MRYIPDALFPSTSDGVLDLLPMIRKRLSGRSKEFINTPIYLHQTSQGVKKQQIRGLIRLLIRGNMSFSYVIRRGEPLEP